MEVRVEKKKKKDWPKRPINLKISLRVILAAAAVCLLAGVFVWRLGAKETQAGYVMEKDAQGRYIFNVVEVVPKKNQAVLGNFIGGCEPIDKEKLIIYLNGGGPGWRTYQNLGNIFYWGEPKNTPLPFTLTIDKGQNLVTDIANNEIFKLFFLGYGDEKNTYVQNQEALKEFDAKYTIKYQIMTPTELEMMGKEERAKIHYLQIGAGSQLNDNYQAIYEATMGPLSGEQPWGTRYSASDDISWPTALELYKRAISKKNRISVSISSASIMTNTDDALKSLNIFKFYQMLHYFDNPSFFSNLFWDPSLPENTCGKFVNTQNYINYTNGMIHVNGNDNMTWERLGDLARDIKLSEQENAPFHSGDSGRGGNYIPKEYDNILLYSTERGYFINITAQKEVNKILNFTNNATGQPDDDDEGKIKVLEIEPSNSYWLDGSKKEKDLRSKLAQAMEVEEKDILVTYATPNRLNGMAVDLVAEYDVIFVGDDVSQFAMGSDAAKYIYSNNGGTNDRIIPQTLINGLLSSDYTTKAEFEAMTVKTLSTTPYTLESDGSFLWNSGIKDQWGSSVGPHFLKNVELYFKLTKSADLSKARFSGNDLNRYMQKQLAEFVLSGQLVVVADAVDAASDAQVTAFDVDRKKGADASQAEPAQDARLYFALKGIGDERDYYDNQASLPALNTTNIVLKTQVENATGKIPGMDVNDELKPEIKVWPRDTDNPTIMKEGEAKKPEELVKSNTLSFKYEIKLPKGEKSAKNAIMTVVIDRNGDGVFDRQGDGKTQTAEGLGSQNNATDTIKTDKVYIYDFDTMPAGSYVLEERKITGTFTALEPVDAIEEFCELQVMISTKDRNNIRRGVWTGYMRPELEQKAVRILQITPYSEEHGGKNLAKNTNFTNLINSLGSDREFSFDFTNRFHSMTILDFAGACEDGSITAASLKMDYDLIIAGADFNSQDISLGTDIDTKKAAQVLQTYIDEYKCPVIFTNDAMSYVNSANYVAPVEGTGDFRFMTIAEAEILNQSDPQWKNDSSGKYEKVRIGRREYESYQRLNAQYVSSGWNGDGTIYLEPLVNGEFESGLLEKNGFYAVMRPVSGVTDGRDTKEVFVGFEEKGKLPSQLETRGKDSQGVLKPVFLSATQLNSLYEKASGTGPFKSLPIIYPKKIAGQAGDFYFTTVGTVTVQEAQALYENGNTLKTVSADGVDAGGHTGTFEIQLQDAHSMVEYYVKIDSGDKGKAFSIGDIKYFTYQKNKQGPEYIAVKGGDNSNLEQYGYAWRIRDDGYKLTDVARRSSAIYPDITPWNYYTTQSLRHILGMDRFAVTTDIKREDKRDPGSSRRHKIVKELQGFTNGALLEYSYLAPPGSKWESEAANYKNSIYADAALALGTKPRTDTAERLNDGIISHYPFEIGDTNNVSDLTLPIEKNHAPLYQLDLDRELGAGKIDDVTVWYTLAGTADKTNPDKVKESKYFDVTRRDTGNNYYLYSKGKAYYTGFSMSDRSGENGTLPLVYEKEMQLFINTIYAALNSKSTTEADSSYEAVLKSIGTVSNISRATALGQSNQYVCYYDEYDENLKFQFRIQKPGALAEEAAPALLGLKKAGEGLVLDLLVAQQYQLPEGITLEKMPVSPSPENSSAPGLAQDQGNWYALTIPFNETSLSKTALDGQTLVIAVALQNPAAGTGEASYTVNTAAVHAEIRLVMRDSFDLD